MRLDAPNMLTNVGSENMRVWYDACTGKHMRYGHAIAERLRSLGHEVVLTTRKHPDTVALARLLGEKPIVVGEYAAESLSSRLVMSAKRVIEFSELFRNGLPDVAISHQSVELCRTAFGLGIPIVLTADTPHAEAVNRLTIPLASTLVVSEAIPKPLFRKYGATNIIRFGGVDEVSWIKNVKPQDSYDNERPLIIVRQMETRASYALGKDDQTIKLAAKLSSMGEVLFLSRYDRAKDERFRVEKGFVDSVRVAMEASLVVGVGGTISREAALLGVPSIVVSEMGRTYVNKYVAARGFPLYMAKVSEVLSCARKLLRKRFEVRKKLAQMEDPVDIIERIVLSKEAP